MVNVSSVTDPGDGHIYTKAFHYNTILAGTWAIALSVSYYNYGSFYNSTFADGDGLRFRIYLAAGTYTFRMMAAKRANGPKVELRIGLTTSTTLIQTFDLYAAATTTNQFFTETGITVGSSGLYYVDLVINDKNPASSGYRFYSQEIAFWRTA